MWHAKQLFLKLKLFDEVILKNNSKNQGRPATSPRFIKMDQLQNVAAGKCTKNKNDVNW